MRQRLLTYAGVILALLLVWGYLIYAPYHQKAQATRLAAADSERRLNEIRQFTLQLPTFLEARQTLGARRLDLDSRLYAKADVLALLEDLVDRAGRQSLRVLEITPPIEELLKLNETAAKTDNPQFLNLNITLAGDFVPLGQFVAALEQSDYTRGINRCIITGARDGSEPLRMQLGFRALLGSAGGGA